MGWLRGGHGAGRHNAHVASPLVLGLDVHIWQQDEVFYAGQPSDGLTVRIIDVAVGNFPD